MAAFASASIPATEVRVLRSSANGQEYLISVALPFHYADHSEKAYPVIYVLDANLFFGLVVDMVRAMNVRVSFCSELPDAIIVGIGYPVAGSLAESHAHVMHLRMRDFLPVPDRGAEEFIRATFPIRDPIASGGAAQFLRFIHRELVPLIETEYRADTADRTLMGHSWGGLLALYAFFQQPQLFQRYVVVSPDLAFNYEQQSGEQPDGRPVRLHLSAGERELDGEELARFNSLVSTLETRQHAGLTLRHQIIPNCTHCAVVAPAFQAGLVSVFAGQAGSRD